MVCATTERSATIAGGFVMVEVSWLMGAWRACQSRPLGIGDFRTLLAAREMVARRGCLPDGREAAYGIAELARLLGVTTRRARASVKRLEAAGLIVWSDSAIESPDQILGDEEQLADTIGRGRGSVAIPRRMLRFLANGARPALIATALGVLLRCLSRRKDGWSGRGRVKAGWIARTFAISIRQAKAARAKLVDLRWIEAEDSDQWAMNRWGRAYRIDLGWSTSATSGSSSLTPLPADPCPTSSPPDLQTRTPFGRANNQEPAGRGPAGVQVQGQGTEQQPSKAPNLDDVQLEDLKDTGRLLDLHRQAIDRKLVTASENDRLRFVAAAEHALAIGKGNPPGLFVYLVRGKCWRYITQEDEDRAASRLKAHRREIDLPSCKPTKDLRPNMGFEIDGLSADARVVKAVREAVIRAGIFRDPWPAFEARNPGWTRERWDVALAELGLSPG